MIGALNRSITIETYDIRMLTLITALVLSQSQIDFAVDIDRIERVVPKLALATGLDLKFDTMVGEDVVLVRAKSVTASDLMKQIAVAIDGEWVAANGGFRLTRPDAKLLECKRAETVSFEASSAKLIDRVDRQLRDSRAKAQRTPAEIVRDIRVLQERMEPNSVTAMRRLEAQISEMLAESVMGKAARQAFVNIGSKRLAKVPVKQYRLFSSEPLALGIQSTILTSSQRAEMEGFLRQCSDEVLKQRLVSKRPMPMMSRLGMYTVIPEYLDGNSKNRPTDKISRVLVRVLRSNESSLEYEVLFVASSGRFIARHRETVSEDPAEGDRAFPIVEGDANTKLKLDAVERWAKDVAYNAGTRSSFRAEDQVDLSQAAVLADPVMNEPLWLYGKGLLSPLVEETPGNVVVSLPVLEPIKFTYGPAEPTLADAKQEVNKRLVKMNSGDWSIYRPIRRFSERNTGIRRAELKKFYDFTLAGGAPNHAAQARLAFQYPGETFETYINHPYQLLRPGGFPHRLSNSASLAFYGSLSDVEMKQLTAGIPIGQLSRRSLEILETEVFSGRELVEQDLASNLDPIYEVIRLSNEMKLLEMALPNGFTNANRISSSESSFSVVSGYQNGNWSETLDADGDTSEEFVKSLITELGSAMAMPYDVRYQDMKLLISLTSHVNLTCVTQVPMLKQPSAVKDWPTAVKKSVRHIWADRF